MGVSPARYTPGLMGSHRKPRPRMGVADARAEAERALYEERAGIREQLGGQPREAAEAAAPKDARRWLTHDAQSSRSTRHPAGVRAAAGSRPARRPEPARQPPFRTGGASSGHGVGQLRS